MRRVQDEHGSLPMVLLAAIVVGGIIIALATTVETGVRTARHDRDWHAAVQAADAGIQQAIAVVRDGDIEAHCPGGICAGSLDTEGTYTATYTETPEGWIVRSTGEYLGARRTLEAAFLSPSLLGSAGLIGIDVVGTSGSLPGITDGEEPVVGTGGGWDIKGGAACGSIDGFERYNNEVPDACGVTPSLIQRTFPNHAEAAFTPRAGGPATRDDPDYPAGVCADTGTTVWDVYPGTSASRTAQGITAEPWVRGQTYCARKVHIAADQLALGGPAGEPVHIFVDPGETTSEAFAFDSNHRVNMPGGNDGDPAELLIYVRRGVVAKLAGNQQISAIIYAPESECGFQAGTPRLVGGMVCLNIDLRGNFQFVRPEHLDNVRIGHPTLERFSEEMN